MQEIIAITYISLSEIQLVAPEITSEWILDNKQKFDCILYELGIETTKGYETQDVIHVNKFGTKVNCQRFVGHSRIDEGWIKSGYASQEAIDKHKNCRMLIDLYAKRGLTQPDFDKELG